MDNLVQEVEIKIEYNESFEMDPLCDKHIISKSIMSIGNDCSPDRGTSVHFETPTSKVMPNETNIPTNDNILHGSTDNLTRNKLTWYDVTDSSGRFLCKFCDLKYSTLQTLRFHVKNKHPGEVSHIKENLVRYKRSSKFICHICKQCFKQILILKSHLVKNHSLEDIKSSCLYCDAVFATENEMIEHLLIQHKKVIKKFTYMCDICGYRTSIKSHYNQHKNTHLGDKNNKCQYCDYATNYLPNLKIHERIHRNDKVYICDFKNCTYQSSAKSALQSHQMKHNPEDHVLYCDKCSYTTIYRQCLKRHDDYHKRKNIKLKLC